MVRLVDVLLRIELKVPATKTRSPMYSRSVISPLVMTGIVVRTVSGTTAVCRGTGWAAWAVGAPGEKTSDTRTTKSDVRPANARRNMLSDPPRMATRAVIPGGGAVTVRAIHPA